MSELLNNLKISISHKEFLFIGGRIYQY